LSRCEITLHHQGRCRGIDDLPDRSYGFDDLRAGGIGHEAALIKQLQPKASNRQISRTLGVNRRTIDSRRWGKCPTGQ
jgi:hypothetical protein